MITSRQHPIVKSFRRVAAGDDRLALLDGWHLLDEAIRAGVRIETVVVAQGRSDSAAVELLGRIAQQGAAILEVSASVMDAVAPVRTSTGVAALVVRRSVELADLISPAPSLILLAADMQDPGNVGAVVRAAEAGGATGVAFIGASADPWSWKALRAAMGSTFRLPVARLSDGANLIAALRVAGVTLVAALPSGGTRMDAADLAGSIALMLGGEGGGLPESLLQQADERVSIPMQPPVESLNVAVAAALLVYEAKRQRSPA